MQKGHEVRELFRGSAYYWSGVRWLKQHPFYLFLLFVPSLLGLIFMAGAWILFVEYKTEIVRQLLFEPGAGWAWTFLYYAAKGILYLAALVLSFLTGLLTANVLSAPLYELVSCAIERDVRGSVAEISFWRSLRLIPEELKKVLLILLTSLAFFLIPGLNLLALLVTAFLVAWDFYDYPMARRGWPLRTRLRFVMKDFWAVLGLGLWLIIPLTQFVLIPLAVAGGTLMNLDRINRQGDRVV